MNEDFFQTDLSWLAGVVVEKAQASAADKKKERTAAQDKSVGKTLEWAGEVLTISMGAVRRAGFKLTEEHKRKISEGNKGVSRKTAWLGRSHSEETKEKIRQFNLNRVPHVFTAEEKAEIGRKISEAKKGKKRDRETVEKVAMANRGRKQSPEEKKKRAAALAGKRGKPIMTPYGRFKSKRDAINALSAHGVTAASLNRLLKDRPDEYYLLEKEKN